MSLVTKIKSNPFLKRTALRLLIPSNEYRPRTWVRLIINPLKHRHGKHSIIRKRTRLDVFPFHRFQLGNRSIIEDFSTINNAVGDVIIGDRTIIGMGDVIIGPVIIGNDVMFAQNVVLSGMNHQYERIDISPTQQDITTNQIIIEDNVWIGANSVVIPGITIGKHAVIGAGSVVTKDVASYTVVVGNPAKVVKRYNWETKQWEKTS
jgi:acetyltransferase-like isoleucine patch superfamily enzyme